MGKELDFRGEKNFEKEMNEYASQTFCILPGSIYQHVQRTCVYVVMPTKDQQGI